MSFIIIETDNGYTIAQQAPGANAEETARKYQGALVDAGPYETYEAANDALLDLEREDFDDWEADGRV